MNPLELFVAILAPHRCIGCLAEGTYLCDDCAYSLLEPVPSQCYRCNEPSDYSHICAQCKVHAGLDEVWIAAQYTGVAKDVIHALKFGRVKAAASPIAKAICRALPLSDGSHIICPVPTANKRVRHRGYDLAVLIATAVSKNQRLPCQILLIRNSSTRQVGAGRSDRFRQLAGAFSVSPSANVNGVNVLLVDDVLTTGATLETAAHELKKHGVASVSAAVFAHGP